MVNFLPRLFCSREITPVPIEREACWAPEPGRGRLGEEAPADRPSRSIGAIPTDYDAPVPVKTLTFPNTLQLCEGSHYECSRNSGRGSGKDEEF